ncbi:glycoside hydrolase, family 18 [Desulforamulus reducens MI-1]|uniref:Glycoside hydrolase, family 18 n=1 Tax=Desulforamulus reducens (strain ATCC BAA-1160 / DSM 100696 / MI-1) TaxID=349161 RepID=A4J282_DESRM|nr:glycosyl hydrolase family 18 protein [Desulforamulus reducens]ABO49185.1 glycoside hydrolase, family 18 [Desulforamulus reducens MI-1]
MTKRIWTTYGLLFMYLFALCITIFPTPVDAGKTQPVVMGYYSKDWYTDQDSYHALSRYSGYLDYVATFTARIDSNGNLMVDFLPSEGIELAKKKNVKPLLVVHNMYSGGMDWGSAAAVLSDSNKRWKLANNIASLVKKYGYAGVNIDLEAVPTGNRGDYTKLLWELKGLLKSGDYVLTAAVPAKNSDQRNNNWSGAYDYREIGRVCDYVMLMTYDEHWFGGTPGPVASLSWVQSVLDYAVSQMPSQKILLGLAGYGYDWSNAKTRTIKWKDINSIVQQTGAQVRWDNASSTPYFYYWNGSQKHEVWFENKYSLGIKMGLVKSYKLGGVGFWRMGFENDSFWETIRYKLR